MKIDRPQRLAPAAAPGERLKRPMGGIGRPYRRVDPWSRPTYLALVRRCRCLSCGFDGGCEAAHLRAASGTHGKASGMGKKPDDRWALSLCQACHREQHKVGERAFWGALGINPFLTAERLYSARPDLARMRAIVIAAIGGHGA